MRIVLFCVLWKDPIAETFNIRRIQHEKCLTEKGGEVFPRGNGNRGPR